MPDSKIAQARHERGWSQLSLIHQLRVAGRAAGVPVPDDVALRITLSGWENGHHRPGKDYQRLLCAAFEMTDADLGFGTRAETQPAVLLTRSPTWIPCCSCTFEPTTRWVLAC
jgi:transcriptional regulator with XRE-family HTH domain